MSDTNGFQGQGRSPQGHPGSQGGQGSSSIRSNNRDMWDQPIKPEPEPKPKPGGTGDSTGTGNDDGVDALAIDTIWDQVKKEGSKPGDPAPINPNAPPEKTPQERMDAYMKAQGLDPIVLNDAEKAELKEGNFDNVMAKLNQKIANAHTKALSSTSVMIKEAVAEAIAQTKNEITSQEAGVRNKAALNAALPWTKDKIVGPIAQTIMQQFLNRGASTEEAIDGVKKYYAHTFKLAGQTPVNANRNGNFGAEPNSEEGDEGNNWVDMLRPK